MLFSLLLTQLHYNTNYKFHKERLCKNIILLGIWCKKIIIGMFFQDYLRKKLRENIIFWYEKINIIRKNINFIKENKNRKLEIDLKFKNQYNETLDYLKRQSLWYNKHD